MLFQKIIFGKTGILTWINRNGNCRIIIKNNERVSSLWYDGHLSSPMDKWRKKTSGKVSFCTLVSKWKRASMAVETALVLPLFFLGMVTMISFLDIYKIQTVHLTELCEKAKEAGMYAYGLDGGGPEEITLPDIYSYKPIVGFFPLPKVQMYNNVKVHAWTGKSMGQGNGSNAEKEEEEMVYVTENGSVYHKERECTYLKLSVNQVSGSSVSSRRNQYGEKYHACESCSRNQNPAGTVYITDTGNRYHNLSTCSGLKRTVTMVKHSHADGMSVCSRCG